MESARPFPALDSNLLPKRQNTYVHPVEEIEKTYAKRQEMLQQFALQNVFGSHMPMRLEMEKRLLSQFQRLPVLRSEMCGLDTILKRDLEMDFGDSFDPFEAPEMELELHSIVEAKLKL